MTVLAVHPGLARDLFDAALFTWVAAEAVLRLRSTGGKTSVDWTFGIVMACVATGLSLGFRAAHAQSWVIAGGWAPVIAGLAVLILGAGLRIWAILTLGRLFKFVVVIQHGHHVVRSGPYRVLRHPSYTGGLVGLLGIGIALSNWLSIAALVLIPLAGILIRIRVEEAKLVSALGQDYSDYAARTCRLIPGLW
jgi:protein-S-isoprenylcysteine O-methyltransferase Ste14